MNDHELKFYEIPLKAHQFLEKVPMHSFDFINLKGGRKGMLMDEIYHITGLNQAEDLKSGSVTKTLFGIRGWIGKMFGWDDVPNLKEKHTWISKLTKEEKAKSIIPPGMTEGINTILYCYRNEILFEIINRTVHCFWVLASVERADGYDLYVGIYVRKLNWRTPIYMTLVSPMLNWVIYPAIKRSIQENWNKEFSKTISINKTVRV